MKLSPLLVDKLATELMLLMNGLQNGPDTLQHIVNMIECAHVQIDFPSNPSPTTKPNPKPVLGELPEGLEGFVRRNGKSKSLPKKS